MPKQELEQDLSNLLDEGTIPIPLFSVPNFFQATKLFLRLWITEQTKHRLFRWYIKMLDYIAQSEADYQLPAIKTEGLERQDSN